MKHSLVIFLLLCSLFASANRVGSVKQGTNCFDPNTALLMSDITIDVYSTRELGQVAVGDFLYINSGMSTPLDGGFNCWFAFHKDDGGSNNVRAIQVSSVGEVLQIAIYASVSRPLVPVAYVNGSGLADCGGTGFTIPMYATDDDPGIYSNKTLWRDPTNVGQIMLNGPYTASYASGGPAYWTWTVSGGNARITGLACCSGNPIANAGGPAQYNLPLSSFLLSGSGVDCNGTVDGYLWTRISGPNTPTITSPTSATTTVTGFIEGTYVFQLQVTDNNGNTGTHQKQVIVFPVPLCATPALIPMLPRMTWDLSGATGEGSQRMNDTLDANGQRKYPSILGGAHVLFDRGAADPRNGLFDFNQFAAGEQADSTSITLTRSSVHPGNTYAGQVYDDYNNLGSGNQRVVYVDFERPIYHNALYIRTNGVAVANALEIIITDDPEEVRRAVLQFKGLYGTPTIDHTVSLTGALYDSVINMQDTGRFMVLRFNPFDANNPKQGPGITSLFPYGCYSPHPYTRSVLTPDYTLDAVALRDTTQPGWAHSGKVIATPVPLSPANYLSVYFPYNKMFSGYLLVTDTAKTNGGFGDTANIAWDIENPAIKMYLSMYGDPDFLRPTARPLHEVENYTAIANSNRRLMKQIYDAGAISNQHIPVDSLGSDSRLQSSYGRYAWYFNFIAAVLGNHAPNPASPFYQYIPLSRIAGDWSGGSGYARGTVDWFIPFNENNADFRPGPNPATTQSSWMPPISMYAFHDTLQTIWHSLFPGVPFTMQGLAAADYGYILTCEMIGKIEHLDADYTMCDMLDMDEIFVKNLPDINAGCAGNINQQSVFPGYRRKGAYIQGVLDTLAILSGRWRNLIVKEYSVASNRDFILPGQSVPPAVPGCDYNVLSVPDIRASRPTYRPEHVQGYMKTHQQIILEGIQGLYRSWLYEAFDLVDTTSIYYDGNDGSQGDINPHNNWLKAGLFYGQQHNKNTADYRVVQILSDSLDGQYKALYRKVVGGITDSFLIITMWQSFNDPTGNRSHFLAADVTQVLHKRLMDDDATYNGQVIGGTTVTAGTVSIPSVFEPDYIFFKSPALATILDATPSPSLNTPGLFRWGN